MTGLRVLLSRLLDIALRRRRDNRLDEEIRTHLTMLTDDFVARGLPPDAAARAARRAFGAADRTRSVVREQRGLPLLDTVGRDVRFALRLLRRDRAFAVTAVLVLTIGIGVNNMLFAILNAHTLRGLPIPRADRVAFVSTINDRNQDRGLSRPEFEDLRSAAGSFAALVALAQAPAIVSGDGISAERLDGAFVSGDTSAITARTPLVGRGFVASDGRPGSPAVVVLGSTAWQSRYAADASVVGRSILVNGAPATVVGVIDDRSGLPTTAQVWLPLAQMPGAQAQKRTDRVLAVFGRLHDAAAFEDAVSEVELFARRLSADHPDTNNNVRARVIPINERYFMPWSHPAWLGFILAGVLVVVISSANVANLMLGRTAQRTRELAVRASLGASRRRLVRQMLIEGSVLAAIGCGLGLGLAIAGVRLFRSAMPQDALPYWIHYAPDLRVIAALLIVSVGSVFLFALLPALHATRTDVNRVLKDGGRGTPGRSTERWTTAFLAAEFALGMVLMAQVSVSVRSQRPALASDHVLTSRQILTASVTLSGERFQSPEQRLQFLRELNERLTAADLASASVASVPPLMGGAEAPIQLQSRPARDNADRIAARIVSVGPRYFETLGLALIRGRDLSYADGEAGNLAVVVNQEFVRRFLPDADPIGQDLAIRAANAPPDPVVWSTVVGVSPDVRQRVNGDAEPIVYTSYGSDPAATATVLVRGEADAAVLTARVKEVVAALDPNLPLYRVRTLADLAWNARWNGRVAQRMVLTLTAIAVALSAVGLYAVTMYSVGRRTQEIGVRMALGARPRHVMGMVVRRAFVQLAFAFLAGVACIRVWDGFLPSDPDLSASDPQSLLMIAAALATIGLAACALPARRAVRLDPVAAIRQE